MAEISLFLALVLMISAVHKLVERERLSVASARLLGVPAALGPALSTGAAAYEAVVALALLFPASLPVGALLAAALWCLYGVALARRFGSTQDCGCSFASREKRVDAFAVARAFGLAALALATLALPISPFTILTPFAAIGVLTLYLALGELTSITIPKQRGIT